MISLNTNASALGAMRAFNDSSRDITSITQRISSGYKVASYKDNSAVYSMAQNIRGHLEGIQAARQSLALNKTSLDVALVGAEAISDLLTEMKGVMVNIENADKNGDQSSKESYQDSLESLV